MHTITCGRTTWYWDQLRPLHSTYLYLYSHYRQRHSQVFQSGNWGNLQTGAILVLCFGTLLPEKFRNSTLKSVHCGTQKLTLSVLMSSMACTVYLLYCGGCHSKGVLYHKFSSVCANLVSNVEVEAAQILPINYRRDGPTVLPISDLWMPDPKFSQDN